MALRQANSRLSIRRALWPERDFPWTTCRRRIESVEHRLYDAISLNHLAPTQVFDRRNHRRVDEARSDQGDFVEVGMHLNGPAEIG
jgi:hypothetical protein